MAISLVLVKDDGSTKDIPLSRSRIVGREEECDLRIPSATVSREHCEIVIEAGEPPRIKDLASSNGTYVNGQPIDEVELNPGDVLSIGPANFVVRIDGQPTSIDQSAVQAASKKAASATAAEQSNRTPAPPAPAKRPSLLEDESDEDIAKALDAEASGLDDFDFSLDDEDEDQPPL